jgi:predicted phosphodiesterase
MSDLHIDSGYNVDEDICMKLRLNRSEYDAVVITGDVSNNPFLTAHFLIKVYFATWKDVIFVAGNHEYYNSDMTFVNQVIGMLNERPEYNKKIHVLNNSWVVLQKNKRKHLFIGATLWTDFLIMKDRATSMEVASSCMTDFRAIKIDGKPFTPKESEKIHHDSKDYIAREVTAQYGSFDTINVLTHHGPSWNSVASQYRCQLLTAAFCSGILDEDSPSYEAWTYYVNNWFHGHTHSEFVYTVNWDDTFKTNVYCNPKGYASLVENANFDVLKIVEI